MQPHNDRSLATRAFVYSIVLIAFVIFAYPIARVASRSYTDFRGQDAVDYILLHGSVSSSQSLTPPLTASDVDGVSIPVSSFTDTMVDKLLDLPNLESIAIAPYPPVPGSSAERPLHKIELPASDAAIAKLQERFPRLTTYYKTTSPNAADDGG